MKKIKAGLVLFLLLFFFLDKPSVKAQTCEDIPDTKERIQEKIDCLQKKTAELAAQSKTLTSQIAQFDAQIKLTTLKIAQTEEKIALLGGRIDQLEGSLDSLSTAFSSRAVETYKMARVGDPFLIVVSAPDLSEAISRFHYLQRIQEADRDLLQKLQTAQDTYKVEKTDQEELQDELGRQKATLDAQKLAKAQLLAVTKNDERRYQSLLSQALAQKRAFSRFVTSQGGASILDNQTVCDGWGCYYNQRDRLWGSNVIGISGLSMAEFGCLVTSVSMVGKHYGRDIKPGDIASNPAAFFSDTALLLHSFSVNGVSVSITSITSGVTSTIDSELGAGRPVIAGLYSGPDHFIVIKGKDSRGYIMHDPFMPGGNDKPLTDRYSVSDITSLRLVRFN